MQGDSTQVRGPEGTRAQRPPAFKDSRRGVHYCTVFGMMKTSTQPKHPSTENKFIHWDTLYSYTNVIMNTDTGVYLGNIHIIAVSVK